MRRQRHISTNYVDVKYTDIAKPKSGAPVSNPRKQYTNHESQMPRGIVGEYKVQSGMTIDYVCTCVCYGYVGDTKTSL